MGMHHHRFCHRDIKAENYLLSSRKGNAEVKLCDFGHGYMFREGVPMIEWVGTPAYTAPEVITGEYDQKIDIWSIGCVAFFMLTTQLPFDSENDEETYRRITREEVDYTASAWSQHSEAIIAVVKDLLIKDPVLRKGAKEIIRDHRYLYECGTNKGSRCCCIN